MRYQKILFEGTNWIIVLAAFFVIIVISQFLDLPEKKIMLVAIPSLFVGSLATTKHYFTKYGSRPLASDGELFFTYLLLIIPLSIFGALVSGIVGEILSISSSRDRGLIGGLGVLLLLFWVFSPTRGWEAQLAGEHEEDDKFYKP